MWFIDISLLLLNIEPCGFEHIIFSRWGTSTSKVRVIHGMATALVPDERMMLTFLPDWPDLTTQDIFLPR
jgi:hypothetical protein